MNSLPHYYLRRGSIALAVVALGGFSTLASAQTPRLDPKDLRAINVEVSAATYRGRAATRVIERQATPPVAGGEAIAILSGPDFVNGVVELDVVGRLAQGAGSGARGFVGLAFDVTEGGSRFKSFYLRPTNGRADDQFRRNHSTQYTSIPEHPWNRLRKEEPGVYESYVDLEVDAWTRMRVVVEGAKASLFVNGAEQPCLIINDLKHAARGGAIALWIGAGTEAYFANLRIERR
jgi:hypothetical protein